GVRPDFDGLIIDPCIPRKWGRIELTRRFRGAVYRVRIDNPHELCRGVGRVVVDGKVVAGNKVPVLPAGQVHTVEARLEGQAGRGRRAALA
ncbi:MAG: glycosyl hydrolase family 65 protein, partial [Phycisphaerae bacterium]